MANVTMELRHLITMKDLKLFDFEYPCDDAAWKQEIETLFLRTYNFHEIGFETIDRFEYELQTKFLQIMPYYNKLYSTTKLEILPLIDSKVVETYVGSSTAAGNSSGSNSGKDFNYPQNDDPLTDLPASSQSNNSSSSYTNGNDMDYTKTVEGLSQSQSKLLKEYRSTILNITKMVIDECKDLFILIY